MTQARFTQGSTMKHIIVMSLSNAAGITALFIVDLLDLFFLSLLGEKSLAAAVGYAGTIIFMTTSMGIGLSIATGAMMSRAIGEGNRERAAQYLTNVCFLNLMVSILVAAITWLYIPELLTLIGATGKVHQLAVNYLQVLIPSLPVLSLAMCMGAGLRSVGDAKLSMSSTLTGGAINAIFDPIFIFLLHWHIEGAAAASVLARIGVFLVATYGITIKHKLFAPFSFQRFKTDLHNILRIALPAVGTNLATPFSSAWIVRYMAQYGDGYVAGFAITGRLVPVAFGIVFALSGAIGPIIGQNFGARLISRVRQSLIDSLTFTILYVLAMSLLLFLLQDYIITMFQAKKQAAELVLFFCTYTAVSFVFTGCLFIANATFNNLGKAIYSTSLNWGRATLGTIPFVWVCSHYMGAFGVLVGYALGGVLFAFIAVRMAFQLIGRIEAKVCRQDTIASIMTHREVPLPCSFNELSSSCTLMGQMAEEAECGERCNDPDNKTKSKTIVVK